MMVAMGVCVTLQLTRFEIRFNWRFPNFVRTHESHLLSHLTGEMPSKATLPLTRPQTFGPE